MRCRSALLVVILHVWDVRRSFQPEGHCLHTRHTRDDDSFPGLPIVGGPYPIPPYPPLFLSNSPVALLLPQRPFPNCGYLLPVCGPMPVMLRCHHSLLRFLGQGAPAHEHQSHHALPRELLPRDCIRDLQGRPVPDCVLPH